MIDAFLKIAMELNKCRQKRTLQKLKINLIILRQTFWPNIGNIQVRTITEWAEMRFVFCAIINYTNSYLGNLTALQTESLVF